MKTITTCSTSDLARLRTTYSFPKTLLESAILRGVTEELRARGELIDEERVVKASRRMMPKSAAFPAAT